MNSVHLTTLIILVSPESVANENQKEITSNTAAFAYVCNESVEPRYHYSNYHDQCIPVGMLISSGFVKQAASQRSSL